MAKLEEIFKQKVNKTIEKETVHKFSKEGEYNAFWHKDRREKVRDPLAAADALTKKAWQESYQ